MKQINYVEYKHSYAHAVEPKLKALNFHANVQPKPVKYLKKIVLNALNQSDVRYTNKEHEFFDNICLMTDSKQLYFYVKNAVNKAKETLVYVNSDGELIN